MSELINTLQEAISSKEIHFSIGQTPLPFSDQSMRKVIITIGDFVASMYVDDEFDVVDSASPALLLNMVLMECTWYLEEDDILTWSTSKNLAPGNREVFSYYKELGNIVAQIKALLPKATHTSFFDWQLNAGDAQTLREL